MVIMEKPSSVFKNETFTINNGKISPAEKARESKGWPANSPIELNGRTVGIVGAKELGDYYPDKHGRLRKAKGLNWVLAALFVVADMAGGGIVALPTAVVRCQFYPGLIILLVMAAMATTSSIMLGRSWVILLRRFPIYRTHCRKPYAELGFRAMGRKMRFFVSVCLNLTQFGASTVFLLLSAKNIQDFISAFFGAHLSFCIIIIVVALALLPLTLLKSPQDFWIVVVLGMASTGVAVVLISIGAALDYPICEPARVFPDFSVTNYLLALGTILFTYGGHSAFPTIQHDMIKPSEFDKSSILAFLIITLFTVTVASFGGLSYGNSIRDSVLNSIQTRWIQQAVNIMITAHCLLTVILLLNPLNQEAEETFNIPHEFGVKRFVTRTIILGAIVFVAETVPSFGPVLDLIGGSTVTLTSVIFPCLFFLYLAAGEKKQQEEGQNFEQDDEALTFREMTKRTNWPTLLWCGLMLVCCTTAGAVATVSAINSLTSTHFVMPCYLAPFFTQPTDGDSSSVGSSTNCCGLFQNISTYGDVSTCNKPNLNFYSSSK